MKYNLYKQGVLLCTGGVCVRLDWISYFSAATGLHSLRVVSSQVKQRCSVLEEQLVDLVVLAMERSEEESDASTSEENSTHEWLWQHLSSQLIFFVLFQFASFPHMVLSLFNRVRIDSGKDEKKNEKKL